MQAGLCTPNCLPLQIFAKLVADRMRTASAIAVVSVTLCTCVLHPKNLSLRYDTANASSVGSTHPKIKAGVVVGSHLSAKVGEDEVPVRGVEVAMGKIGGRVSRFSAYLQSPSGSPSVWPDKVKDFDRILRLLLQSVITHWGSI